MHLDSVAPADVAIVKIQTPILILFKTQLYSVLADAFHRVVVCNNRSTIALSSETVCIRMDCQVSNEGKTTEALISVE